MSQTIYTGLGAVDDVTVTITADTNIHLATVQLAVGSYTTPGTWTAPTTLTFSADGKTATAALRIGTSYTNPAAGRWWLWYRVTASPLIKIQLVRSTSFTIR